MLRSRMLPDGFKLFFGLSVYALFGSLFLGVGSLLRTTDGASVKDNLDKVGLMETITGPLSAGWKGSIGNHVGYIVLFGTMVAAGFIAFLLVAFRDADPEAEAQVLQLDSVPLTKAPSGANYSPIIAIVAVLIMAIGWIEDTVLFQSFTLLDAGLVLLVLTIGMWTVRAWAERATGDDEVNAQIYHRIVDPLRVPVLALLIIGYIVIGISRVFLAAESSNASVIIFLVLGLVLFVGLVALGAAKTVPKAIVYTAAAIFALAVLVLLIYGLVKGPRPAEEPVKTENGAALVVNPSPITVGVGS